jgi:single-strand DNA-binding protein
MSINKAILVGNIGQNPDVKSLDYGQVCNLSIATTEYWKDKTTGEKKDRTEWHKVVIFNEHLITLVKNYCKKGDQIYVEGKLETRKYTNKEGEERYTTEIVLRNFNSNITLCSSKPTTETTVDKEVPF